VGPTDFRNVLLENGTAVPASPPLEVRTDAGGAFRVEGVPPGRNLVQVRALGLTPGREEIELEPGERAEVEITLQTGGIVTGVVADTAGRTVPGASIRLGEYAGFLSSSAIAGPDGSFRLEGLPVGTISIRAGKKDVGKAAANLRVLSGRVLTWNPVLKSSAGVTGTVVDEYGAPRVGWLVMVYERTRPSSWRGRRKTGEDGGFDIPDCPTSPLRLDVYPPSDRGYNPLPCASVLDPVIGGDPLRIVVGKDALPSAWVAGELVDPEGHPVGGAAVSVRFLETGFAPTHRTHEETGGFRVGPLPPGAYAIELKADGWPPIKLGDRTLSAGEELELGRLELTAGARVVARVGRADGEPLENAWSEIIDARGTGTVYPAIRDGILRSGPLPPGAYVLRAQAVTSKGSVLAQAPIEIRAGQDVELDLTLEPVPRMTVQVYFPEGAQESATIRVRARDEDGNLVLDSQIFAKSSLCLLPGRYTVTADTTSGLSAEASVEVAPPGGGSAPDPIVLRLR